MSPLSLIADSNQQFVALINCRIVESQILCGIAVFRGGLSGQMTLYDLDQTPYRVRIPAEVAECATYLTLARAKDDVAIDLIVEPVEPLALPAASPSISVVFPTIVNHADAQTSVLIAEETSRDRND